MADSTIGSPELIQPQSSDSKSNELLTNIVEKAFSAAIDVVEEEVQTRMNLWLNLLNNLN